MLHKPLVERSIYAQGHSAQSEMRSSAARRIECPTVVHAAQNDRLILCSSVTLGLRHVSCPLLFHVLISAEVALTHPYCLCPEPAPVIVLFRVFLHFFSSNAKGCCGSADEDCEDRIHKPSVPEVSVQMCKQLSKPRRGVLGDQPWLRNSRHGEEEVQLSTSESAAS